MFLELYFNTYKTNKTIHFVEYIFVLKANSKGPFFVANQNLPAGRCLVCKHGNHVINIPKADWSSVKNKQLTATPC